MPRENQVGFMQCAKALSTSVCKQPKWQTQEFFSGEGEYEPLL
jgi:hypothetical protein